MEDMDMPFELLDGRDRELIDGSSRPEVNPDWGPPDTGGALGGGP